MRTKQLISFVLATMITISIFGYCFSIFKTNLEKVEQETRELNQSTEEIGQMVDDLQRENEELKQINNDALQMIEETTLPAEKPELNPLQYHS